MLLRPWFKSHTDVFMDLVRIYLGVALFAKAVYFMSHRDYLLDLLQQSGNMWATPEAILHYVIPAHLVGGLLLAMGLLTRVAALVQLPPLIGAALYVYLPKVVSIQPRQDLEFVVLVLFLTSLIALFGPGRWSLDAYLAKKSPN